jgi:IS5 family transposase
MRKIMNSQMLLGEVDISAIRFDLRSRDDIPKLLMGLQHIYTNVKLRKKVFAILSEIVPKEVDIGNGRPGMYLWRILVLGTLRLDLNWDFDRLREMANNHEKIRMMLGHGLKDKGYIYSLQTLKDNISLFTLEVLDKINEVVVSAGHDYLGKKKDGLKGRCDSFVVETNVHYPTDINLLLDAIRKVIFLTADACVKAAIPGWRQSKHNFRKIKKLFHKARNSYRSAPKSQTKKERRAQLIKQAHMTYLDIVGSFLPKVKESLATLRKQGVAEESISQIAHYLSHADRQIDQIQRRVLNGEEIAHDEKVFSVFEEHTEWICKGKAGVPQELGLRVCILEDQYGFILHHLVMEKQTDKQVALAITQGAIQRFPALSGCSYDKGFYSITNKKELSKILDTGILPKKGKRTLQEKQEENSEEFIGFRRQHSAVESAINALENHSLDRCPDRGLDGFKRYVALAILSRNIQILGHKIQQAEQRKLKMRLKQAA